MRAIVAGVVFLALTTGCVGKGKYTEALTQNESLKRSIDERDATISALNADLTSHKAQISRLEQELAATREGLDELSRQLANKVVEAGQLQASVTEMEQALLELERRRARAEETMQSFRDLVSRFQAMIDAGTLKVKVIDGRMVVELATDILFPPGSASLSNDGKAAIAEVAAVLASIPDREYQVAGHTDSAPIRTERFPSNWHLGSARAIAVTDLLIGSGLDATRVSAASYAEHRPVDTNRTKEGKAANRRIEITIQPDLSVMPGYDELKQLSGGEGSSPVNAAPEAP